MSKLFCTRKLCGCCGCANPCQHHKSKIPGNRSVAHVWRKTVVFGVFVFSLYFALLSFVSFLAVSNHRNVRTPLLPPHHLQKNGSLSESGYGAGRGGNGSNGAPGGFGVSGSAAGATNLADAPAAGASGGNIGVITVEKTGDGAGSKYNLHSRRDSGFANDLLRSRTIFKCVPVHYREETGAVVALTSFPGSGNTWLRYLLQLSTGIFTGSVYKDFALLRNGFPAESVTNGRVLVVKTHESGKAARSQFQKAILLVRKPSEAILAEFNRRAAGHIGHAGRDKYTRNAGRYWSQFVAQKAKSWTETNLDWIEQFTGPLLITMYHHLVHNTSQELSTILEFLEEPVTEKVMTCVMNNKEGIYRRRKKYSQFNPYTPRMERFLAAQEKIVYNAIQKRLANSGANTMVNSPT